MRITVLRAKIHRATVTRADLHYVGSLTVDRDLLEASGIVVGEKVSVVNIDNGQRFETYVIEGEPGSGVIGANGAAARLVRRPRTWPSLGGRPRPGTGVRQEAGESG